MPTYTCTYGAGVLDAGRRDAVAEALTRVHHEITAAPRHLIQVQFRERAQSELYIGGAVLDHEHLFISGLIRSGRSALDRSLLVQRIIDNVAAAAGLPRFSLWVYLQELPPAAMAEYGHPLPEPGDEQRWFEELPAEDRARMLSIGGDA